MARHSSEPDDPLFPKPPFDAHESCERMTNEERKRHIAETAVDVVTKHGLRGATVARIAQAEGVSERLIYKHYANRREVLAAALDCLVNRVTLRLTGLKRDNAIDFLRTAAQLHWPLQEEFVYTLYEFFATAHQWGLRDEIRPKHQAHISLIIDVIEQGKREGSIRSDVDSELAAWEFWGVCWTEDLAHMLGFQEFDRSGICARMIERFLDSIAAQPRL